MLQPLIIRSSPIRGSTTSATWRLTNIRRSSRRCNNGAVALALNRHRQQTPQPHQSHQSHQSHQEGRPFSAVSATLPTRKQQETKSREQQLHDRQQRIPKLEKVGEGGPKVYDAKEKIPTNVASIFPDTFRKGVEMDVKFHKVQCDYALCRPLDYPDIKGKIACHEMDELTHVSDATMVIKGKKVYKASVMRLLPPDKVIFSLRRVRRLVRDDFQPFTMVIFDLPYELHEEDLKKMMEETGGKVLEVKISYEYRDDVRESSFVTFANKEDAMAAIRKWNGNLMPVTLGGDTLYYRVRCKKAHQQVFRDQIQERFDQELQERIRKWDSTAIDRWNQRAAEQELYAAIPWYLDDRDNQEMFDRMGLIENYHQYSVKNDPRWAR